MGDAVLVVCDSEHLRRCLTQALAPSQVVFAEGIEDAERVAKERGIDAVLADLVFCRFTDLEATLGAPLVRIARVAGGDLRLPCRGIHVRAALTGTAPSAGMEQGGELRETGVPQLVGQAMRELWTGRLELQSGTHKKEIWFQAGLPVAARTTAVEEHLGRLLVRLGLLGNADYLKSLELMHSMKVRQGEALTRLGVVDGVQLYRHLQRQVREILLNGFAWTTGRYSYTPMELGGTDILFPLNPIHVLYEGMARLYEPAGVLEAYRRSATRCPVLAPGMRAALPYLEPVTLDPCGGRGLRCLLARFDGHTPLDQTVRELGLEPYAAELFVRVLVAVGAIDFDSDTPAPDALVPDPEHLPVHDVPFEAEGVIDLQVDAPPRASAAPLEGRSENELASTFLRLRVVAAPGLVARQVPESEIEELERAALTDLATWLSTVKSGWARARGVELLEHCASQAALLRAGGPPVTPPSRTEANRLDAELEFQAGCALLEQGDMRRAAQAFDAVRHAMPDEPLYQAHLGWAVYRVGRAHGETDQIVRGRTALANAVAASPSLDIGYYFLGCVQRDDGDLDGARESFEQALRLRPELDAARGALQSLVRDGSDAAELDRMTDALVSEDAHRAALARRSLPVYGTEILPRLVLRVPGEIETAPRFGSLPELLEWSPSLRALLAAGHLAAPFIGALLNHADEAVRWAATSCFTRLDPAAALDGLVERLTEPEPRLVERALSVLGRVRGADAKAELHAVLEERAVMGAAPPALVRTELDARLGDREALADLVRQVGDEAAESALRRLLAANLHGREAWRRWWGERAGATITDCLVEALAGEPDETRQRQAVRTLEDLYASTLGYGVLDPDPDARAAAVSRWHSFAWAYRSGLV